MDELQRESRHELVDAIVISSGEEEGEGILDLNTLPVHVSKVWPKVNVTI